MIKHAHFNLLEGSTVSLALGTEDTPLTRLWDRNVGRVFRPTAAETIEVKIDQGEGGGDSIDALMVSAGHNLSGMTLDILHSTDDAAYTPAVTQWTGTEGLMTKSWQPLVKRYWKFRITSPASPPELAELFLTCVYEWPRNPARPAGRLDREFNVEAMQTQSGLDRFAVRGPAKRLRSYALSSIGEAHKDALVELNEAWAGSKPFWLHDHTGEWIYGTLGEPMQMEEVAHQRYGLGFEFREVTG